MDNFKQIFWGQGQLLTPQHLQQQDLYTQTMLTQLRKVSGPDLWGIHNLSIREEALENNTFEVTHCEFISKNGIYIRAGTETQNGNSILHARNFEDYFDASQGSLEVFLCISKYVPGQNNLADNNLPTPSGQLTKRYYLDSKPQTDIYDHEATETDVTYVQYVVGIYFGNEDIFKNTQKNLDYIKIAELSASGDEANIRLSRQYIPPISQLQGDSVLRKIVKNTRDLLAGRSQEFSDFIRDRGLRASASGGQDLMRLIMLQSLHRYIPVFQHFIEMDKAHPEMIYREMRRLVGELSVFSEDFNVFGASKNKKDSDDALHPYQHEKLWECFNHAWLKIRELVMSMTSGPEESILLEYDGKEYFKGDLSTDFFTQPLSRYYLMIDSILPGDDVWARLQSTGKISNIEDMPMIRTTAVFGLKVDHLPNPPEELPQRSTRYTYFQINTQSPQWARIIENKNIAIYCDLDPNDTVIKIIRIGGQ